MRKLQYKSIQNLQTLEGYIFLFAILLILVCPSREYTFFAKIKNQSRMGIVYWFPLSIFVSLNKELEFLFL
jgi:hypothetical protein